MEAFYTVDEMAKICGTWLGYLLPWALIFWFTFQLVGAIAHETVRRWRRKKDLEADKFHVHWCEGCGRAFHTDKEYEVLRAFEYQSLGDLLKAWWKRSKDHAAREGSDHL